MSLLPQRAPLRSSSLFCIKLFFGRFSRFTRMVSFHKRYQSYQIGTPPPSGQSRHHRLPLVLPNPFASLPPLRVTLTHFCYKRALRLPTSIPISGLALLSKTADRPGELLRPLTRSCLLLLVLGRLFLLALPYHFGICPRSRWSPPFPLHALALISVSLAKMRLSPTLTFSPLMTWCFGQTALFLLAKTAPAFLPTALSVATFSFRQAQYVPVFLLKPAPFYTLFVGLGSTNKSAIFLLFFSYLTLVLSSPPSQTLWQIWQKLSVPLIAM